MSKKAIIYTRVSTDEQAQNGFSLRDQHEKLKAYCNINGIDVIAHYQDDHSAKTFIRPEFIKLLEFLRQNKGKVDLLLFIKWDRFSRNAPESYEMLSKLRKLNVEAQAIEQPLDMDIPENKIMLSIYLTSPEVENDRRSLNTIAGMRRAMKEGRWCAGAPKGYDNKRDENNKPIIMQNKDADYIRQAFECVENGETVLQFIRQQLVIKGFVCSKNQIALLLRNPLYMGKIKLKAFKDSEEYLVNGIHRPIISEETFYKVQDILDGKRRKNIQPSVHGKKAELPLRGFLKCAKCGKILTGSASKGNGGHYFYYHCSLGCKERYRATIVNEKFTELLHEIKPKEEIKPFYNAILKDLLLEGETEREKDTKSIDFEINKNKTRIENLQDKFADNHIDISEYNNMKQRYDLQLKSLVDKRKDLVYLGSAEKLSDHI